MAPGDMGKVQDTVAVEPGTQQPSTYRYVLSEVRGIKQNPQFDDAGITELINTFETRDSDVYIATYVKSGTTYTQQMLHLLLNNGEQGEKTYSQTIPWLEAASVSTILREKEAGGWTIDGINGMPSPRLFKTHANVKDLPRGKAPGLKVIYVARNPKDVAVSLFHHAQDKPDFQFQGSWAQLLAAFMAGDCENGDWFNHVLEWWAECQRDPEHHIFLKYEDIMAAPAEHVRKLAAFAGLEAAEDVVEKVVFNSRIDTMKKKGVADHIQKNHVRKGGSGGWRQWFTVAQSDEFDALYKTRMEGSGLSFNFGGGLVM